MIQNMKTFTKKLRNPQVFFDALEALSLTDSPAGVCFFDIETTGLSKRTCYIYMIGAICLDCEGSPRITQWLSDRFDDEKELLASFNTFLSDVTTLVHFNGNTFDVPFVREKCEKHGLPCVIDMPSGIDLFRLLRPLKNAFMLTDLKQKTLERLAGLEREDEFSGGDLIPVYAKYVGMSSLVKYRQDNEIYNSFKELENILLLHNHDDLCGMLYVATLLTIINFTESKKVTIAECCTDGDFLLLKPEVKCPPVPGKKVVSADGRLILFFFDDEVALKIPILRNRELRYYYENYRDYYYLPEEDTAIHKSVAEFVDKSRRVAATKKTCYVKHTGDYIPVCGCKCTHPVLFCEDDCKNGFTELNNEVLNDKEFLAEIFAGGVKKILTGSP